jgi:hypothetical protein
MPIAPACLLCVCLCVCACRWHWEVTEATTGNNVLGLENPQLLMLAPGVQLQTGTEAEFAAEVRKVGWGEGPGAAHQLTPAACWLQACCQCPLRHSSGGTRIATLCSSQCRPSTPCLLPAAAGPAGRGAGAAPGGAQPALRQQVAGCVGQHAGAERHQPHPVDRLL